MTGIVNLSTSTFDETVLGADRARRRRLLGGVVRAVQGDRPDPRRIRRRARRPGDDRKLNVDDHPDLAMRYNVMSIPTLLVFSTAARCTKRARRRQGQGSAAPGARRIPRFLPLTIGQRGDAIRDLQRRLGAAGLRPARRRCRDVRSGDGRQRAGLPAPAWPASTTAAATSPPGWRSSRPRGASVTATSSSSPPTCAATTSTSCRPAWPAWVRLRPGRRHLRTRARRAPSSSSNATADSTSTVSAAR